VPPKPLLKLLLKEFFEKLLPNIIFLNKLNFLIFMQGLIISFRRGRHTQKDNQMLVNVKGIDSKEKASELIGKTVIWKSPAGKEIKGSVRAAHGNKGVLRVLFEKGMPGQSIGSKIEIR
jgi:large subunit ribosomal protein L35Ae